VIFQFFVFLLPFSVLYPPPPRPIQRSPLHGFVPAPPPPWRFSFLSHRKTNHPGFDVSPFNLIGSPPFFFFGLRPCILLSTLSVFPVPPTPFSSLRITGILVRVHLVVSQCPVPLEGRLFSRPPPLFDSFESVTYE